MKNKILLLSVFFLLVALPLVSAEKITYSDEDLKVTLSDTILFGLIKTGDFGTAELKSHESIVEKRDVSINQIDWEGEVNPNAIGMFYDFSFQELYKNGLGEVTFTDMKTGKLTERDWRYVYSTNETYEEDTYLCEESHSYNGTVIENCIINGTIEKTREVWKPYNSKDIPKGNIRIGIEVQVKKGDKIDGVWDIGGQKITKHAPWEESLEVGLVSWYDLQETSGAVVDIWGDNNGTNNGATRGVTGKINNSFDFDGNNDYVDTNLRIGHDSSSSISFWVKDLQFSSDTPSIFKQRSGGSWYDLYLDDSNNVLKATFRDGSYSIGAAFESSHDSSVWNHYVMVFDYSNKEITTYKNGQQQNTGQNNDFQGSSSSTWDYDASLMGQPTGWQGDPQTFVDGKIDEVGIFNRSLSASEVESLYANGEGTNPEQTLLEITLLSPENNANLTSNDVDFSANVSDPNALGIQNVTINAYYSNGTLVYNETNSSGIEGNYTFSTTLNDGDYDWNITAYDDSNVSYESLTRGFNIDTSPQINISSPINNTNYSTSNIWFNATSSLSIDDWIINYNGTNVTISDQSGTTLNELLSVEEGDFNLEIWGNNSDSGVWGLNESISFSVDTTQPIISVLYPNETIPYHEINTNLFLNWSINDTHLDSCWYDYSGTNVSLTCADNQTTFNITDGTNKNITVWVNDTFGNYNSDTVSWDYKIFENSRSFTESIFETQAETYSINLTANSSLTAVNLFWDDTSHSMSQSGNIWSYSRDMPIGTGDFPFSFNFTYGGNIINSSSSSQEVNLTLFTPTNTTYPDKFLSINFKDENDLSVINASIPTSSFTYYLGSGTVNKTLTFTNNTDNFYYNFSGTTKDLDLTVTDISFQYRQVNDYPQRIWQPSTQTYSNTTTNQTLYLLNTDDGIFVTYQTLTTGESPIQGVEVVTTRVVTGETIQVGAGTTDSAGTVTFWLNPDFKHTSTFTHPDFDEFVFTHFPTQASYTIPLGEDIDEVNDFTQGIIQTINPKSDFLYRNQEYDFNYTISSTYWNLTSFQITLSYANGTVIGTDSGTSSSGGTLSVNNVNVTDSATITMDYFYELDTTDNPQVTGERVWITQTITGTEFSIWQLTEDFNTYTSASLYGFDDFGKTLISFIIIVLMVGGLSMRYGIASEGAIMGILFGIVYFLDVGRGLIPRISIGDFQAIPNFVTVITFIILVAVIIREERR